MCQDLAKKIKYYNANKPYLLTSLKLMPNDNMIPGMKLISKSSKYYSIIKITKIAIGQLL